MLFLLFGDLSSTIIKAEHQSLTCDQVLNLHRVWHKKKKQDFEVLKAQAKEISVSDEQVKALLQKEIEALRAIQARLKPHWSDKFFDFFGRQKSVKKLQLSVKIKRLDEFFNSVLEHYDAVKNAVYKNTSPIGTFSGVLGQDTMVTFDGLYQTLFMVFKQLAAGQSLDPVGTSYLFEIETHGFDFSGSVFSKDKTFIVPHGGYVLSGQRLNTKYRFGPEDCTSLFLSLYPELPEMGFSTTVLWAWVRDDWKDLKDYNYMKPILDRTFNKVERLKPGVWMMKKGHIWLVLGQEGTKVHVMSYKRLDLDKGNAQGFMIETLDWPLQDETVLLEAKY